MSENGSVSQSSYGSDVKPSEMSRASVNESNQSASRVESLESDTHLDEATSPKEEDKDAIRDLLENLPPVAKPRLSKV
ncbi:hypothetical protein KIN20_002160 [Parelaphostrongylus tenuis]|uniref:Uncharacterized protein n=1 Tax=Parelaphostrongylus tenuis TaxID=148309 RepID=A0AAD5LXA9_PARTN|nr:hypothetical protein KIN20_002160 [Parelaphostrongylus tenuis]